MTPEQQQKTQEYRLIKLSGIVSLTPYTAPSEPNGGYYSLCYEHVCDRCPILGNCKSHPSGELSEEFFNGFKKNHPEVFI